MLSITKLVTIGVLLCVAGFAIWRDSKVKPANLTRESKSIVSTAQIASNAPKHGWIELVGIPDDVKYGITNIIAKNLGDQVGVVSPYPNGGTFLSNVLPIGTRVFSLVGVSIKQKCAVQLKAGEFVVASAINVKCGYKG